MIFKRNHLPFNPLFQNLKTSKFSYDLFFHQINIMNLLCHKEETYFSCTKSLKSIALFYTFFYKKL